ncbi:MAG: hypothetical protein ABI595_14800 [Actinomycetota bacterium]
MSGIGSPGRYSPAQRRSGVGAVETIATSGPDPELDWDQYLELPHPDRIGISCSGGGIRAASYCLGALQELRKLGWLSAAEYLSCVSGGGYTTIAHEVLTSETLRPAPGIPCAAHPKVFAISAPFAVGSPEERHLRGNLDYIAPGGTGRVWLLVNLIGGMLRHLLPFAAAAYVGAWFTGMAVTRWLGPTLNHPGVPHSVWASLTPFLRVVMAMLLLTPLFLVARQLFQARPRPNDEALPILQGWALLWLEATGLVAFFLLLVPVGLLVLHLRPFDISGLGALKGGIITEIASLATVVGGARRFRLGLLKLPGKIVTLLATPIAILLPFLGFTYWVSQYGAKWDWWRTGALVISFVLFSLVFPRLDEVTSLPHLFYRERLATAFIGERTTEPFQVQGYDQPPWSRPLLFSELHRCTEGPAKLPKLVVCANVDLSDGVPTGRGGASFTFEQDFVGGPTTGYVRTTSMEAAVRDGTLTLPGLMAVSGAAVAPSMGKMTRSGLRFVMALFDLRLGVWLPNPRRYEWTNPEGKLLQVFTSQDVWADRQALPAVRRALAADEADGIGVDDAFHRPGTKYVFYEALGKNSLRQRHLYVSDGGHWENLGLVELLRRGCGKIVCLDAAGDDIHHFNTLSEAIDLAHADLGVEFDMDMDTLIPGEDGKSRACYATGTFHYPNGKTGRIVYVKAAICEKAPIEVLTYKERDDKFPNHPTTDQFFSEYTFESYRTLGQHAVREALIGEGAL